MVKLPVDDVNVGVEDERVLVERPRSIGDVSLP
jgi:hypothetical protein